MIINLNQEKPLVSKRALLQELQDIEIFRKYLNDGQDVVFGTAILSPLRDEKNPSFGFFIGEGNEICFNDFVLGKGDFIKFLQLKYNLTYFEALSKVAIDFNLNHKYICKTLDKTKVINTRSNFKDREEIITNLVSLHLGKNRRKWQVHDIAFWEQFGISLSTLEKFNVEPVEYIHINNRIIKADKYTYCFKEYKDGKETYKFYQPYSPNYKWITNHDDSIWQGWSQIPKIGEDLIITKSLKDVMSLYEITGIPAVALQSENILPKRHVFNVLKKGYNAVYCFYDNDFDKEVNWGKIFGDKIASEFGLIPISIPDELQSKDFSDLVKNHGRENAKNILEQKLMLPF